MWHMRAPEAQIARKIEHRELKMRKEVMKELVVCGFN